MPKIGECVQLKIFKRKIKSPVMTDADFISILIPEDTGKQNPAESYKNQYQKHVAFTYGYKLVRVDDKPFKSYLFTILSIAWLKKVNTVEKTCEN